MWFCKSMFAATCRRFATILAALFVEPSRDQRGKRAETDVARVLDAIAFGMRARYRSGDQAGGKVEVNKGAVSRSASDHSRLADARQTFFDTIVYRGAVSGKRYARAECL